MNMMRKGMRIAIRRVQIIIQIMHMHRSIAETPSRRDVEISDDLINAKPALNPAALTTLSVQVFTVMLPLALFDVFTTSKGPGDGGISFAHFFTGTATARFYGCGRRDGAVTIATVVGVKVGG